MQPEELPATPLDEVADALRETEEDGHFGYSPKKMLEANDAITFPFAVYGREFAVLAWMNEYPERLVNRDRVTAVLYPGDADIAEMEESARDTDYIAKQSVEQRDLADPEMFEDTAHVVATALGYFTRKLLDGRSYRWRTSTHDDPDFEGSIEVDHVD